MKFQKLKLFLHISIISFYPIWGQSNFKWPATPASKIFQEFIKAYNSGSQSEIESFVEGNYHSVDEEKVFDKTEGWLDLYHRFGPIEVHSISINKPYDLEIWVQGKISNAWFAPEFILNKESEKVRAVGLLMGAQPENTQTPAEDEKELISRIDKYLKLNEKENLFQGTVLIQHNDNVIFQNAYGYMNIEKKERNNLETRMRTMSITKVITASAVLQLAQSGTIELHKPISNYLPELPEQISSKISVYDLLTHTSGYELDGIEGFRKQLEKTNSISEVYETQLKFLPEWEHYNDFWIKCLELVL